MELLPIIVSRFVRCEKLNSELPAGNKISIDYQFPIKTFLELPVVMRIVKVICGHDDCECVGGYVFVTTLNCQYAADNHDQHDGYVLFEYRGEDLKVVLSYVDEILQEGKLLLHDNIIAFGRANYLTNGEIDAIKTFMKRYQKNATFLYNECSVCYEITDGKTECGHSLCVLCLTKIEKKKHEDADCERKICPCPVCRSPIQKWNS